MYLLLALLSAGCWGAADFVGGLTGKRFPAVTVAFSAQVVGLIALLALAPGFTGEVRAADLAWGAAAGWAAATGLSLLYHALAVGTMSLVAPVSAVGAASIPVVFGLATGERPPTTALIGVVLALGAVALICAPPAADRGGEGGPDRLAGVHQPGLLIGLASGGAFGAFFIFLDRTGADSALWPLVAARAAGVALLGVVVAAGGRRLALRARESGPILVVGLLDVAANVLYLLATRRGLLSLVALVGSLYPAATVVMARAFLGERLSRTQAGGLAGAAGAVALIALA